MHDFKLALSVRKANFKQKLLSSLNIEGRHLTVSDLEENMSGHPMLYDFETILMKKVTDYFS